MALAALSSLSWAQTEPLLPTASADSGRLNLCHQSADVCANVGIAPPET